MELDGREVAGSSVEPEQGAVAEPRWLWEAIAAEESPSSVEMEDAETDPGASPNAGPDTGNEQKGGGSAVVRYPGMTNGMIRFWMALTASLRNSVT